MKLKELQMKGGAIGKLHNNSRGAFQFEAMTLLKEPYGLLRDYEISMENLAKELTGGTGEFDLTDETQKANFETFREQQKEAMESEITLARPKKPLTFERLQGYIAAEEKKSEKVTRLDLSGEDILNLIDLGYVLPPKEDEEGEA